MDAEERKEKMKKVGKERRTYRGGRPKGSRTAPRLLTDMRWAYKNPGKEVPGTPQQERMRRLYEENFKDFIALMNKEEQNWRELRKTFKEEKADEVQEDAGAKRAIQVIQKLLEDFR